jgi:5-methylcytosine-specific restriction endonuclease McrA
MAFSEKTKAIVRRKSALKCVLCRKPFVEIHHIIPQSDGGPDDEDNAAALCAECHDLFGDNPRKRKQLRENRDYW